MSDLMESVLSAPILVDPDVPDDELQISWYNGFVTAIKASEATAARIKEQARERGWLR